MNERPLYENKLRINEKKKSFLFDIIFHKQRSKNKNSRYRFYNIFSQASINATGRRLEELRSDLLFDVFSSLEHAPRFYTTWKSHILSAPTFFAKFTSFVNISQFAQLETSPNKYFGHFSSFPLWTLSLSIVKTLPQHSKQNGAFRKMCKQFQTRARARKKSHPKILSFFLGLRHRKEINYGRIFIESSNYCNEFTHRQN